MTRKIFPFIVLAIAIALVYWSGVFEPMEQESEGEPQTQVFVPLPPVDCESVCKKIDECRIPRFDEDCLNQCPKIFPEALRACIMETSCEFIEAECPYPVPDVCPAVCEKLEACEIMDRETCDQACIGFEPEVRDCISANACEWIVQECLPASQEGSCDAYCERMLACGFWDREGYWECMALCREESPDVVDCVLESPCRSIESWCFGSNPDPLCGAFCDKLLLCGGLDVESVDDCIEDCALESSTLVDCVLESDCGTIDSCYAIDDFLFDCQAYCDKRVLCGWWEPEEEEACLEECEWEDPNLIACVLETPCDQMAFCDESARPECFPFCNKLLDCEELFVEEFDACLAGCREEPEELIACVFESSCEQLASCFEPSTEVPDCELFCNKLMVCGQLDPDGFDDCTTLCTTEQIAFIACVIESPCNRLEACREL